MISKFPRLAIFLNILKISFTILSLFFNNNNQYFFRITVCNQFSRGVFSMLGAVSPDSFDTLHSYSNTFQMPFVTPWFPEKVNKSLFFLLVYS